MGTLFMSACDGVRLTGIAEIPITDRQTGLVPMGDHS